MRKSATPAVIKIFKAGANLCHSPQNVILFLIRHLRERNAVSEAFTRLFYYGGPMIHIGV